MAAPIAIGTSATTFANGEFTVPAGGSVVMAITASADGGPDSEAEYKIARKTDAGAYTFLFTLTPSNQLTMGLVVGGNADTVYAAARVATGASSGFEAE